MRQGVSPRKVWWALRGRWLLLAGVAFVVGGGWLYGRWRHGQPDPSWVEEAERALDGARRSEAARWARGPLVEAEELYRSALGELARQQARWFFLRDLSDARRLFEQAASHARQAEAEGEKRSAERRQGALQTLSRVSEALDLMDELEARAAFPPAPRARLTRARIEFVGASSLLEAGEYDRAEALARVALEEVELAGRFLGEAFLRFVDEERVRTWRAWIAETVAWSRDHGAVAIVVVKDKNLMTVYQGGQPVRTYRVDLGANNLAQKYRQGDQATPEGRYKIKQLKDRGQSKYYRALLLDYPTAEDLRRIRAAKEAGIIPAHASPGALIEIHGEGGRGEDWTNGCVAVTNTEMDELFRMVRVGTPVTIVGADGTDGAFSSLARRVFRER